MGDDSDGERGPASLQLFGGAAQWQVVPLLPVLHHGRHRGPHRGGRRLRKENQRVSCLHCCSYNYESMVSFVSRRYMRVINGSLMVCLAYSNRKKIVKIIEK